MEQVAAEVPLVFSWWITPILALASWAIRNINSGINAEERVRKRCHDDVVRIRDVKTTTEVWPAMAVVFSEIVADVPRPAKTITSEEVVAAALRALKAGFARLADALQILESRTEPLIIVSRAHRELVQIARGAAVVSAVLLVPLGYFSIRLITPTLIEGALMTTLWDALSLAFTSSLLVALGFLSARQVAIYSEISREVRALRPPPAGSTS